MKLSGKIKVLRMKIAGLEAQIDNLDFIITYSKEAQALIYHTPKTKEYLDKYYPEQERLLTEEQAKEYEVWLLEDLKSRRDEMIKELCEVMDKHEEMQRIRDPLYLDE